LNSPTRSTTVQPSAGYKENLPSQSTSHPTAANQRQTLHNWRDALRSVPRVNRLNVNTNHGVSTKLNQKGRQKAEAVPIIHNDQDTTPRSPAPRSTKIRRPNADKLHSLHAIPQESRPELSPTVRDALTVPEPFVLTTPTSRISLYENLLYLVNTHKPTATLPSLVDYHRRYSDWHSTRSYNLLLDLSIRHRQYGVTEHLFRSLRLECIPFNVETHKLVVRCLVQQNMWDDAWGYVHTLFSGDERGTIPFAIWLEFCRLPKKRRKLSKGEGPKATREEQFELLHNCSPTDIPPLSTTPPFAVFCMVDLMLRLGRQETAMALTEAYLKALPRSLTSRSVVNCLRIIHSHLALCKAKSGLPRFYAARQILISFLQLHPALKPNARTLCLLFKALQRAKRCGTVAWKQLAKFKNDWGPQVENRCVLRRVSQLALKEGRLDITQKIRKLEFVSRLHRREDGELKQVRKRRRLPYRLIYPRNGKEARMWFRHRARICVKLLRVSKKVFFCKPSQFSRPN
jgi:hypothetical protein